MGPFSSIRAPFGGSLLRYRNQDIGSLVGRLAPRLLRGHVCGGTENDSLLRRCCADRRRLRKVYLGVTGECFRQSKVQHLGLAVGRDLDFQGFQIPVS